MSITKVQTFRQRGWLFTDGSVAMTYNDETVPSGNPVSGVAEVPTLLWDNNVISTTVTTSNLPPPTGVNQLPGEYHG